MKKQHTITETAAYLAQAAKIGVTPEERAAIKLHLSKQPDAGVIVRGTGGIRKVRFARAGGGKSGGYRVFTFYWEAERPVYLLWVISKTKSDNISDAQANVLYAVVKELKNG